MRKSPGKVRVMIVDDHPVVREGLRTFLKAVPGIVVAGEASSGAEALEKASRVKPHVVLMDLVMPEMSGVEAIRRLLEEHPDLRIIALTSFAGDDQVFPAIKAGAVAYLLKDVSPKELADTVAAAARGEVRLHPEVARRLMNAITEDGARASEPALTPREREVLSCLGRGLSNREIGAALYISEKTVKTHVSNLLGKLGLADRTQAALYAAKHAPDGRKPLT
jgi:NarL family two-component system response regulator LiaR